MHLIDRYAYSTNARTVDPAHKTILALLVMGICLVLDKPAVGLLAAAGMWSLAVLWAGVPARVFTGVLLAEAAFMLAAVLGVAVSVGTGYRPDGMGGLYLGPLWIGASDASVALACRIAARALGCAAAMNFLAITTPLVDLLDVMRRLHVPPVLSDLLAVVYRFLFTLLDTLSRMRTAQESRLGYVNARRGLVSAGMLGGQLFLDAYRRSRKLQTALESRGYRGEFVVLPATYRTDLTLCFAGVVFVSILLWSWGIS